MSLIAVQTRNHAVSQNAEGSLLIVRRRSSNYPTTTVERFLLMVTFVILPLQDHIPPVAGFSVMRIMFAVLAGYVLLNRRRALNRIWNHPVFLAAYALIVLGSLMEFSHPHARFSDIFRIGQMIAGAVFVASLCRDRRALYASIYGYVAASVWLSVLLYLTSYGVLRGATATDFQEASRIRVEAMTENPLDANANKMAFITAQGVVVTLALALTTRTLRHRYLYLGISLFGLVATFLPMSRSAVVIVIISCAAILFSSGIKHGKTILVACVIGASIMMLVPDAIWSRMSFSVQAHGGKQESRARVYTTAAEHFPEYMMTGIGAGNFWQSWMYSSGMNAGAHNCFFQVAIYWGLAGLSALIAVVWQAYRCLPKPCGNDRLSLCLLGIAVSLLLWMLVMHNLYAKEFSLGLGLLAGARHWIWPRGIVRSGLRQQRYFRFPSRRVL